MLDIIVIIVGSLLDNPKVRSFETKIILAKKIKRLDLLRVTQQISRRTRIRTQVIWHKRKWALKSVLPVTLGHWLTLVLDTKLRTLQMKMPRAQLIDGVGNMRQEGIVAKSTDFEPDCQAWVTLGKLL